MQLSDATHDYACDRCGATDGVCMEGLWLARRLAASLAERAADLPQDFEVVSDTGFTGCGRNCAVQLRITAAVVEVRSGNQGARVSAATHPTGLSAPGAARLTRG